MKAPLPSLPFVSILIVNYNGWWLLEDCLRSVRENDYPIEKYEVILVDNHSTDDSVALVKRKFPWVKLIESLENTGFTGGNNLAYEHAQGDYIVLLNTDTTVDPHWLSALVASAEQNPKAGIFSSRLRFAYPYIPLQIQTTPVQRSEIEDSIDFSPLGVMLGDVICETSDLDELVWYGDGFYEELDGVVPARWTKGVATVYLPFPLEAWKNRGASHYTLTFHGYPTNRPMSSPVKLSWAQQKPFHTEELPSQAVRQLQITLTAQEVEKYGVWFIQNAGNVILKDAYSKDRGSLLRMNNHGRREFYELENETFLHPKRLSAFCGASCLIRRQLIQEIGFLDGHYYMYYEDTELSLRALRYGWDILYTPDSVVYHRHRATTSKTSQVFFIHLTERNHLLFTFAHFPLHTFGVQLGLFILRLVSSSLKCFIHYLRDDVERYERLRVNAKGRWLGLQDLIKLSPELMKLRLFHLQKGRRHFSEIEKMMY